MDLYKKKKKGNCIRSLKLQQIPNMILYRSIAINNEPYLLLQKNNNNKKILNWDIKESIKYYRNYYQEWYQLKETNNILKNILPEELIRTIFDYLIEPLSRTYIPNKIYKFIEPKDIYYEIRFQYLRDYWSSSLELIPYTIITEKQLNKELKDINSKDKVNYKSQKYWDYFKIQIIKSLPFKKKRYQIHYDNRELELFDKVSELYIDYDCVLDYDKEILLNLFIRYHQIIYPNEIR